MSTTAFPGSTPIPEPLESEVARLLSVWGSVHPVPRRPCPCGRAYVVGGTPGEPCGECREEIYRESQRPLCDECGDRGWVWRPDAVCYADERDAQRPCPACARDYGPAYD